MTETGLIEKMPVKVVPKPSTWRQQKRSMTINHEVSKFTKAFRENFATLIISALGLVAALSWNDAIKTMIDTLFPSTGNLIYKFYVAIIVTIISVVITYFISKVKPKA
jgi:Flp pilus assembly pilin Flp